MVEKKVVVKLHQGLHARPAGQFVKTASSFNSDIQIGKDENLVNAKSIISVLTLAIAEGEQVTLVADGPDEEQGIAALESILIAGQA
jgi:catabolite repression HPr-like protein